MILKWALAVMLFLALYQPTAQQLIMFGMLCHMMILSTILFLQYETSRLQALQNTAPVAAG